MSERAYLGHQLLLALEVGLEVLRLEAVRVVDVPRHLRARARERARAYVRVVSECSCWSVHLSMPTSCWARTAIRSPSQGLRRWLLPRADDDLGAPVMIRGGERIAEEGACSIRARHAVLAGDAVSGGDYAIQRGGGLRWAGEEQAGVGQVWMGGSWLGGCGGAPTS